mgnify:FL=1
MMRLKQGWKNLWEDQRGIGTVEMILILVVLIALVLIFKSKLTSLVNEIFDKITKQSHLV